MFFRRAERKYSWNSLLFRKICHGVHVFDDFDFVVQLANDGADESYTTDDDKYDGKGIVAQASRISIQQRLDFSIMKFQRRLGSWRI